MLQVCPRMLLAALGLSLVWFPPSEGRCRTGMSVPGIVDEVGSGVGWASGEVPLGKWCGCCWEGSSRSLAGCKSRPFGRCEAMTGAAPLVNMEDDWEAATGPAPAAPATAGTDDEGSPLAGVKGSTALSTLPPVDRLALPFSFILDVSEFLPSKLSPSSLRCPPSLPTGMILDCAEFQMIGPFTQPPVPSAARASSSRFGSWPYVQSRSPPYSLGIDERGIIWRSVGRVSCERMWILST